MSEPIILTERERAVFAELVSHLMGEANNRDTEYAWQLGEVLRAWLRDMEPPTESASPPRVPGPSAQFAKVGVQSGPGQPIPPHVPDVADALDGWAAQYSEPENINARHLREAAAEIRRLRARSEALQVIEETPASYYNQGFRAGIEAAAQYHDAKAISAENRQAFDTARRHNADAAAIRALADKPPADEMELRPEVAAFARLMERELRTNDARRGAEGWKGMTAAELLRMLDVDAAKLRFALGAGDATKAIEQCADVANMAMMIADVTEIAARKGG